MADDDLASVVARLNQVEAELKALQDEKAINEVIRKWHHECTGGFAGKQPGRMEALECLSEDATIEILGLHEPGKGPKGREQYTVYWDYYFGDDGPLPHVFQASLENKVVLNGDTAVQTSAMIGMFRPRGMPAWMGLSQRTNNMRREPDGWKIVKTTMEGGLTTTLNDLFGPLNPEQEYRPRPEWKYAE
ncbi:MAG: hypothetical protein AB7L13_11835 [Acidimicrobiia bacterium]